MSVAALLCADMLAPVLEIYVLWHPDDIEGQEIAREMMNHFHGTAYSGLIGGAIEVYVRSTPWASNHGTPRPLPCIEPLPAGLAAPAITAVVPILGLGMAAAVQSETGEWHDYLSSVAKARDSHSDAVGIFPVTIDPRAIDGTVLASLIGGIQGIGKSTTSESAARVRCRDLAQGIAQLIGQPGGADRLTVFVSHTKHASNVEGDTVQRLLGQVRQAISATRLEDFFDAQDLQPNQDWAPELITKAATSALLAVRTDLYASRQWCQREVLTAKRAGMPVVILDALVDGEERGSFIMDHVPRIPGRRDHLSWSDADILRALNQLVDECLKRAVWQKQKEISVGHVDVSWWADVVPEPVVFANWLIAQRDAGNIPPTGTIRILHPDPPLGPDEVEVLDQIADLSGLRGRIEVLTPRGMAAIG